LSKSRIQKREAIAIAKKLGANIDPDGAHEIATVHVDGKLILEFGISHGKKGGHGHLVGRYGNLKLHETGVLRLAQCTMSKDEYFEHLKKIGDL
jgi:hypothetical protein